MARPRMTHWLKDTLRPAHGAFRDVAFMSLFVNLAALAVPIFVLQVYDRVVFHGGLTTLQALLVGILLVLLFDYLLRLSRSRMMQRVALRIDVTVGRLLFEKVMASPLRILEARPTPVWLQAFRDVDTLRNVLAGPAVLLLIDLPFAVIFMIIIFIVATPIAWVLLIVAPIFALVAWRATAVMSRHHGEEKQKGIDRDTLVGEMLNGRETVKALALDTSLTPLWEERHATTIEQSIRRGGSADVYSNLGLTLTMLTTVMLTSVGALAIMEQQLTIGALIATNMLSTRLIGPFNQLIVHWRSLSGFMQAVRRLDALFAGPEEVLNTTIDHPRPSGVLRIENIVFKHSEDSPHAINDISMTVRPGGLQGIVGANGSGKTTLIKLLQGLYRPQSGRVLLDDADVAQFARRQLAAWIGYVPQDITLFSGSIRDNIAYALPDAGDEQIIRAAQLSGAHGPIVDLPDGYDTDLGEGGRSLSGGMRQRIAVARALLGDPAVILLDEPTSHLDQFATEGLGRALKALARTKTVMMVTHNQTMLALCDNVIFMDRGKIALAGPSQQVLAQVFRPASGPQPAPAQPAPPNPVPPPEQQQPQQSAADTPIDDPADIRAPDPGTQSPSSPDSREVGS